MKIESNAKKKLRISYPALRSLLTHDKKGIERRLANNLFFGEDERELLEFELRLLQKQLDEVERGLAKSTIEEDFEIVPTKSERSVTLGEFEEDFLKYSKGVHTDKTQRNFKTAFNEFRRIVGDMPLRDVGIDAVERFLATKKPASARKYHIALRSAFERARKQGVISNNPFEGVPRPKVPEKMPKFLTEAEFHVLLRVIPSTDSNFRELCICAVSTGLRLGELRNLKWEDVDLKRRLILVRNRPPFTTKSKKDRTIPVNDELLRILTERKEVSICEYVFHHRKLALTEGMISKKFKRFVRRAKLDEGIHFHSLRHTFGTWLAQRGESIYHVKTLMGHSDVKTTEIYAHLTGSDLHHVVQKIKTKGK